MYKTKHCRRCGMEYTPKCPRSWYCPTCGPIARKEIAKVTTKIWREKNPEKVKANHLRNYHHQPTGTIPRICVRCGEQYYPTGTTQKYCIECSPIVKREQHIANWTRWVLANPEKIRAYGTSAKARATNEKWHTEHPEKDSLAMRRMKAKRRALGFIPLNSPFLNCEGHHIDLNDVIYIPKEMHQGVRHSVWTGRNMEKINALACGWLTEDWT